MLYSYEELCFVLFCLSVLVLLKSFDPLLLIISVVILLVFSSIIILVVTFLDRKQTRAKYFIKLLMAVNKCSIHSEQTRQLYIVC